LSLSILLNHFSLDPATEGDAKENLRSKPLSGKLQIAVKAARELDHPPIVTSRSRSASKQVVDTYVTMKVEGTQRARTHPSRTDRWNEDFEIVVDKANEVEIAIFDKQLSELNMIPIGYLWIKIPDLVEALRRQKANIESGQGGWVTAGDMNDSPTLNSYGHQSANSGDYQFSSLSAGGMATMPGMVSGMNSQQSSEGIDAWFNVEPAGAIALHLNFGALF
jgi:hypothetical protein